MCSALSFKSDYFISPPPPLRMLRLQQSDLPERTGGMEGEGFARDEGHGLLPCMFCHQSFRHPGELHHHVVIRHRPTLCEPAVLRVEEGLLSPNEDSVAMSSPEEQEENGEDEDGELSCKVCGQACESALGLETHLRKHKDSFTYSCVACGRRFKEPWFLKNHMRTHSSKARNKSQQDSEGPTTINDVVLEQTPGAVASPYKMCMVCGFLFPTKESLKEHVKVHTKEAAEDEEKVEDGSSHGDETMSQGAFLQILNLNRLSSQTDSRPAKLGKWIAELDPFNTYQAWQLATKGKVAVGRETVKDPGHVANSENEEESSDKEDHPGDHWVLEKSSHVAENLEKPKSMKSNSLGGVVVNGQSACAADVDVDQKLSQSKLKPTNCATCGRIFRTYHQLVLHSRVHRKGRKSVENPLTSVEGGTGFNGESQPSDSVTTTEERSPGADKPEEGSEEGSEDGVLGEGLCSGEKPHRCPLCNYAAAQKTSLKYHLERHHKPEQKKAPEEKSDSLSKNPSTSPPLDPGPTGSDESADSKRLFADSLSAVKDFDTDAEPLRKHKRVLHPSRQVLSNSVLPGAGGEFPDLSGNAGFHNSHQVFYNPLMPFTERSRVEKVVAELRRNNSDLKAGVAMEDYCDQSQSNLFENPLNLCTKPFLQSLCSLQGNASTSVSKSALPSSTCPFCTYRTFYPEVLVMHQRLVHKYNSDPSPLNGIRGAALSGLVKGRRTGCPPALLGKDVPSFPATKEMNPRLSRRTKSPLPAAPLHTSSLMLGKVKPSSHQSQCNNLHSASGPRSSGEFKPFKPSPNPNVNLENYGPMYTEFRPGLDMVQMLERGGPSESGNGKRNMPEKSRIKLDSESDRPGGGPIFRYDSPWASPNAGKVCLTNTFENQGALDSHEPTAKRMKANNNPLKNDQILFGSRRNVQGRNVKLLSQEMSPVQAKNSGVSSKQGPFFDSNGVDGHWNVLNVLKSYSPQNLASLYSTCGPSNYRDPNMVDNAAELSSGERNYFQFLLMRR
uniref:Zinc finger protein 217 n=1 Tax=Callorhinchus milii TaxID=7868 RepID=A0A4W3IYJ4_CALMI